MQENKIKDIILADICASEYDYIYEKFAKTVYQVLEIKPQYLI